MTRRRTAILISGRGSNMESLLRAAADPAFPAEIVGVVSNRPDAAGIGRARALGVRAEAIDHRAFAGRAGFEAALDARLRALGADLVCLAGFMR
ncbi:MAG: phosphoribosylglycinamide formyltransferase, partial [Alphaproteobacteria bacterium]|nr:phosphoribosylglycinamide formyltransferase [Alphaproteobacteria bacterium]